MAAIPSNSGIKPLDPIQDPASPYYLHPSDSQLLLVPIPFNGTGFNDWKRSVTITLSSKNKLAFINIYKSRISTQTCTLASGFGSKLSKS